ncbi:MAG TPA: hypothetical protein PKJ08_13710, partial [Candidatus Cloacimonadota bacterium]|nr:hypothetical protein [Candidatus Cloacimonadota bacterium]
DIDNQIVSFDNPFMLSMPYNNVTYYAHFTEIQTQNHFTPVWTGNPIQQMIFYVSSATVYNMDMVAGDEIAVFDGDYCVGSIKLTGSVWSYPYDMAPIFVSRDNPATQIIDGYTPGHQVSFRIWKNDTQQEFAMPPVQVVYQQGQGFFQPGAYAIVQLSVVQSSIQQVVLNIQPIDSGQVFGQGEYEAGTLVTISAEPNPGWQFEYWTDIYQNIWAYDNPYTFTMPDNYVELNAHFSPIPVNHFTPVWSGNGFQHMNFFISSALVNDSYLGPEDEIAVYDGQYCVGAVRLNQMIYNYPSGTVSIPVSLDDPTTLQIDGYTVGNTVSFRIWKNDTQREYTEPPIIADYIQGTPVFQIGSTALVQLSVSDNIMRPVYLSPQPPHAGQVFGQGQYLVGTQVSISAMPYEGWQFDYWTDIYGNIYSYDNPFSFTMPDNYFELYAQFSEIQIQGTALSGYVNNATNGQPVANALVTIGSLSATTNENGYYLIQNIPEGALNSEFTASPLSGTA